MSLFGFVKPFFGLETYFFFVGAHIGIYFLNIKFVPSTNSTLTTPQNLKMGKIDKSDHFEAFLWGG